MTLESIHKSKRFASAACLAALFLSTALHGQGGRSTTEFVLYGAYEVKVNGQVAAQAQVYRSRRPAVFLLSGLAQPLLIHPIKRKVEALSLSLSDQEGRVILPSGYRSEDLGAFSVDSSGGVKFKYKEEEVFLKKGGDLLGIHQAADLLRYDPNYGWKASAYRPEAPLVEQLKKTSAAVEVTVFFGSWCQYCQEYVPRTLQLEKELAGSRVKFRYFGLPNGDFSQIPEAVQNGIQRVPTSIVKIDGREVGRIINDESKNPERKLSRVLRGK